MLNVMGTMNISLPDGMKEFVDQQVAQRGYGTSSEYVRDLIRREQDRQQLRSLVLEGAATPRTGEADATYFEALRSRALGKAAPSDAAQGRTRSSRKT